MYFNRSVKGHLSFLHAYVTSKGPVGKFEVIKKGKVVLFKRRSGRTAFVLRESIEFCKVVSIVRNPFGILSSYARYLGCCGSFRFATDEHRDTSIAERGFDYLIRSIAGRESPWPSRKSLFDRLFDYENGDMVTDYVLRFECLNTHIEKLSGMFSSIRYCPQAKVGITHGVCSWTDSLIRLVYDTWGDDLRLFGYGFRSSPHGDIVTDVGNVRCYNKRNGWFYG